MLTSYLDPAFRKRKYKLAFSLALVFFKFSAPLRSFHHNHTEILCHKITGYHFGVLCCAWTSGVVLLFNVVALIWAIVHFGVKNGIGTLHDGNCKQGSNLGFWIHMLINVLSTALLGASNYSMQCLSSPTRSEIDRAHKKGIWLDVGLPGFKNIWSISAYRRYLWWTLALSTVPLHLFWNSAVFTSLSSYNYTSWVVPSDFALFNVSITNDNIAPGFYIPAATSSGDPCLSAEDEGFNYLTLALNSPGARYLNPWQATLDISVIPHPTLLKSYNVTNSYQMGSPPRKTTSEIIDLTCWANSSKNATYTITTVGKTTFNYSYFRDWYPAFHDPSLIDFIQEYQMGSDNLERLGMQDCVKEYSSPIISGRQNVLLISSVPSTDFWFWQQNAARSQSFRRTFSYMTENTCYPEQDKTSDPFSCPVGYNGTKYGDPFFDQFKVQSCFSQRKEEHCKVQFSLAIMTIVIASNFVKFICLAYIAWRRDPEPLVTVGDAISSFLQREDITTQNVCLAGWQSFDGSCDNIRQMRHWPSESWPRGITYAAWKGPQKIRFTAASSGKWTICSCL